MRKSESLPRTELVVEEVERLEDAKEALQALALDELLMKRRLCLACSLSVLSIYA